MLFVISIIYGNNFFFLSRYVGNLDKRVTDLMMLNILKTGLSHIQDKIQSCNMFPGDMVCRENFNTFLFNNSNLFTGWEGNRFFLEIFFIQVNISHTTHLWNIPLLNLHL